MSILPVRIFPLGDSAATFEFGREMSEDLNAAAIRLADVILRDPFPGLIEAVPAIASTTVFYDPGVVKSSVKGERSAFSIVKSLVLGKTKSLDDPAYTETFRTVEIPVSFTEDCALDLEEISRFSGLSAAEVIDTFISATYRVFMLGFLPGFAYMGMVDQIISAPRKAVPRSKVPAGSVGIAGRQTGIYPCECPGGWQIIGQTKTDMLAGHSGSPCIVQPGDRVRFVRA